MLWLAIKILIFNLISIMGEWLNILKDWQTLVAGLLALGAAWWTVRHIKEQIKIQREAFEEDKKRYEIRQEAKTFAAKAGLLDALGEVCKYANCCVEYYSNLLLSFEDIDPVPNSCTILPEPPIETVKPIKTSIEYLEPKSAERFFELVEFFQIHNARLLDNNNESKWAIDHRIIDAMKLFALGERLLPFARLRKAEVPMKEIKRDCLNNHILFRLTAWTERKPDLFDEIKVLIDHNFEEDEDSPLR